MVEREMDRASFIPSDAAERTTVRQALIRYEKEVLPRLAGGGKPEISRMNRLKDHLGDLSLSALDSANVASFRDHRLYKDEAAPQTVKHELGLLNRVLKLEETGDCTQVRKKSS